MTSPVSALAFAPSASTPTGTPATGTVSSSVPAGAKVASGDDTGLALDPQAFLQLLVAQLQYQDPTNPVDTSQFMNQTAMLSQVQTMTSMSSTLTALSDAQQAQSATSMIGKQVSYLDANGIRTSGVVTSANLLSTGATLEVGDTTIPLSGVLAVADAPSTT